MCQLYCDLWRQSQRLPFDDFLEKAETITTTTKRDEWKQWRMKAKIASINEATNDRKIIIRMHGSITLSKAIPCIFQFFGLVVRDT